MSWGTFFSTALLVALILFFQWPRIKKNPKKDKWAFFILLFIGWGLSIFHLEQTSGPISWIETLFKPLGRFMEK